MPVIPTRNLNITSIFEDDLWNMRRALFSIENDGSLKEIKLLSFPDEKLYRL